MMDTVWPVVGTVVACAGVLLVVGLFYHGGRRAGAREVLEMVRCHIAAAQIHGDVMSTFANLVKEIKNEYDLD